MAQGDRPNNSNGGSRNPFRNFRGVSDKPRRAQPGRSSPPSNHSTRPRPGTSRPPSNHSASRTKPSGKTTGVTKGDRARGAAAQGGGSGGSPRSTAKSSAPSRSITPTSRAQGAPKPNTFSQAFAAARGAGKREFTWRGKSYNTRRKDESQASYDKAVPGRGGAPSKSITPTPRASAKSTSTKTKAATKTKRRASKKNERKYRRK